MCGGREGSVERVISEKVKEEEEVAERWRKDEGTRKKQN